ncbi:hypothetical protein GPL17_16690 [Bradyrhizobium yuanmingense]|uniref:hypothetical protein n=1 Tax=Bradyrhizobium yuanmingense TaxID=108015 RepID=UPI0012FB49BD|nr:hypothetical protein [Bradyrhizobium yuanmingense]MVT52122.1 hypothetical protein [Bradyrhizobium yuanmingense]
MAIASARPFGLIPEAGVGMKYEVALGALLASAFWLIVAIWAGTPSVSGFKDFAGPVATVFAASVAGWVAYTLGRAQVAVAERTWQTSNEKIVLDLFEKRFAIFDEIRSVVGEVTRNGTAPPQLFYRYTEATDRVPYFFGPEIAAYLEKLRITLIDLELANKMMENESDPDRSKWVRKRSEKFLDVTRFYSESAPLFGPYMKAHQKA